MKIITQDDYDKFYDGIMMLVRNEKQMPMFGIELYCLLPEFFTEAEKSEIYNKLHSNDISLSEREYGRFIDENYKSKYIHAMCYNLQHAVERLQWEISVSIRKHFNVK